MEDIPMSIKDLERMNKNKCEAEPEECACISLNRLLHIVMHCKSKLMENNIDKLEIYRLLNSIEFDILLMNDENNFIERNLE